MNNFLLWIVVAPKSPKKNSFRGNYSRKYGSQNRVFPPFWSPPCFAIHNIIWDSTQLSIKDYFFTFLSLQPHYILHLNPQQVTKSRKAHLGGQPGHEFHLKQLRTFTRDTSKPRKFDTTMTHISYTYRTFNGKMDLVCTIRPLPTIEIQEQFFSKRSDKWVDKRISANEISY